MVVTFTCYSLKILFLSEILLCFLYSIGQNAWFESGVWISNCKVTNWIVWVLKKC